VLSEACAYLFRWLFVLHCCALALLSKRHQNNGVGKGEEVTGRIAEIAEIADIARDQKVKTLPLMTLIGLMKTQPGAAALRLLMS